MPSQAIGVLAEGQPDVIRIIEIEAPVPVEATKRLGITLGLTNQAAYPLILAESNHFVQQRRTDTFVTVVLRDLDKLEAITDPRSLAFSQS